MAVHEGGVAEDIGGWAVGSKDAAVEQQHAIAQINDGVEVVCRDDLAAGKAFQNVDQRAASARIETAERLIEREDAGLTREDSGETHAFSFAKAQSQSAARFVTREADGGETVPHALSDFSGGQTKIQRTECDVFKNGWAAELVVRVLKQKADAPANLGHGLPRDGDVVDENSLPFSLSLRERIRERDARRELILT